MRNVHAGQLGELWKYIICKPVSYLLEITFKNIKARAIVAPGAVTSTLTAVPSITYMTILTWRKMFISAAKRGLMKIILQLVEKKTCAAARLCSSADSVDEMDLS